MARTLAVGLSGQVGHALQPMLGPDFGTVLALSRQERAPAPRLQWLPGSLESLGDCRAGVERILSLGPLDAFARWIERAQPAVARVVALSSTGVRDKRDSPDPRERELARRLAAAEASLFDFGARRGVAVTVLRPTLLYGNGRDRSLSRIAAVARRWRLLPLPADATGLRQPVHVEDVASAVLACLESAASVGRAFDLPGAETLPFDRMVARYLQVHAPGARLLRVPGLGSRGAARLLGLAGRSDGPPGWLARANRDQTADSAAAQSAFGFSPREFRP